MPDAQSMIEHCSRAWHEASAAVIGVPDTWDDAPEKYKEGIRARTRAVLTSMREPNEAMKHFGHGHLLDGKGAISIYQAMIDAALEEGQNG